MKHYFFKLITFPYWSLTYRSGRDFKKALRFVRLVEKKLNCKCTMSLYTEWYINAPKEMSFEEKVGKGWVIPYPFKIAKNDDVSMIEVLVHGHPSLENFLIEPNKSLFLRRNSFNHKIYALNTMATTFELFKIVAPSEEIIAEENH